MSRLTFLATISLSIIGLPATVPGGTLVGKDKVFIRFTNIRPDRAAALVRLHVVPNDEQPFGWDGKTVYVGKDGEGGIDEHRYLAPGESSEWVDVGQYMNLEGARSWSTYLSPVLCGVMTLPKSEGLHLLIEVSQGRATRVIRRLEVRKPGLPAESPNRDYPWILGHGVWNHGPYLPTVGLLVPSQPDIQPRVYTLEEAMKWQLDVISVFPDVGRPPTQFVFTANGNPAVLHALGYNGYPPQVVEANLGDEISISISLPEAEQNRRFREHLKARGFHPLDLVSDENVEKTRALPEAEQWNLVTLTPALPGKPMQFYESALFRYRLWYEETAAKTREAEQKNPGKKVLAGANFTPHMNVWPDVRQWVGPFKSRAMTMSWTEDWWWQILEVSPQVYGFLLDAFRLAQSYHGAPIQFYIMPFKGNSPDNIRRMHGLALAHGAKIINHFHTDDQVLTTCDYVDFCESPRTFQALHDMIRSVGAVEHRLYSAMPEKAKAAIMLSWAADTWDTEDLGGAGHLYNAQYNVNNDERKAIWMALRHGQYPVDLITDEDIAEGRLKNYRVLYIVGAEMLAAASGPLKQWVREGGIVYATGGAGLLDEYHKPLVSLYEVYGIKAHDLVRKERHIRPRLTLPTTQPLDAVRFEAAEDIPKVDLPAFFCRESLIPGDGAVVAGRYKGDNAAAALLHRYGKGRTFYVGALAGLAYLKPAALPSTDELPTAFSNVCRELITAPVRWAGIVPPIKCSDPLVEAQFMSGERGAIVVLTNWRKEPIENLTVQFPGKPQIKSVRSLQAAGYFRGHLHEQSRGFLPVTAVDGAPQVNLRLGVIDFLFVD